MPELTLLVDGRLYGGWTEVDVRLGVERLAGTFELTVVELWPGQSQARSIPVGARCEIRIDSDTVITGWVDDVEPSYTKDSHRVAVRGRDATGDLLDCSAWPPKQWADQTLGRIATELCGHHSIGVVERTATEKFTTWKVIPGETVFDNLQRAARLVGVLLMTDGRGRLVIGRASTSRVATKLEYGVNIRAGTGRRSHLERYNLYTVLGQQAFGTDAGYGAAANELLGAIADKAVTRYRPLVIQAEDQATPKSAQDRAEWERNTRAGKALEVEITVQGWHHGAGLWRPDALVPVRDPMLRIDRDLYLSGVQYKRDQDGTRALLTLTLPQAFDVIALPDPEDEHLQ